MFLIVDIEQMLLVVGVRQWNPIPGAKKFVLNVGTGQHDSTELSTGDIQ